MSQQSTKEWVLWMLLAVTSLLAVIELITMLVFVGENGDLKRELKIYHDMYTRTEEDWSRLSKYIEKNGWKPTTDPKQK
jgi:predicted nucleotidyltransferase